MTKPKTVAVIGANGQLGTDIVENLKGREYEVLPVYHTFEEGPNLDISNKEQVGDFFSTYNLDLVINTAAFHKVDACEEERDKALGVNAFGTRNLAQAARSFDFDLMHVSTDYVFDGALERPYTEEDTPNPINVYGKSKLLGESFIEKNLENFGQKYFIVRTQALQGLKKSTVKGGNFVETMLKSGKEKGLVKVVDDQITSPTFTMDAAEGIVSLFEKGDSGIYHVSNKGSASWYEFAKEIFRQEDMDVEVIPIDTEEASELFGYKARRPANSTLSTKKIEKLGISLRPWQEALGEYLSLRKNGI